MTMALEAVAEAQVTRPRNEISEAEALQLTRNLVRIAMFNISYIRGLFPDTFYQEKFVPALEVKVKKLLPMDLESKRFIDWMEKGVFDALQKKYLRTLLLTICSGYDGPLVEEYMFSFKYGAKGSEEMSSMTIERSSGKHVHTHINNQTNPQQMKQSACKMVRTLVQLMLALDNVPKERTIFMTLHYYDDVTPADYEPPFFASSAYEDPNSWAEEPLEMKIGSVKSRYHKVAIKMKSVCDPSRDENELAKNETCSGDLFVSSDDDSSTSSEAMEVNTQPSQLCSQPSQLCSQPSQQAPECKKHLEMAFEGISLENGIKKMQTSADEAHNSDTDKTEDSEFEAESLRNVRIYLQTRRENTVHMADIFKEFPQISEVLMEELVERLVDDELLTTLQKGLFRIKKTQIERIQGTESNDAQQHYGLRFKSLPKNAKTKKTSKAVNGLDEYLENDAVQQRLYEMALLHTLPRERITMTQLKETLVSSKMVRRLMDQMARDGYIEELSQNHSHGRPGGRQVLQTLEADKKLQELRAFFGFKLPTKKPEQWGVLIRAHEQSKTLDESGGGRMLVLGSEVMRQNQPIQQEYSSDNDRHTKAVPTFNKPPLPPHGMPERAKGPVVAEQSGHIHVVPSTLVGTGKRIRMQDSDPPLDINMDSQSKMVGRMMKTSKVKGPIYQPPFKRVRMV